MSCLKVLNESEERKFLEMYTLENFHDWLKKHNLKSTYTSLKSFKAQCFAYVIENACNVVRDTTTVVEDY